MQIEYINAISNNSSYFIKYDNKTGILNEISVSTYGNQIVHQFKTYWMSNKNWWMHKRNTTSITEIEFSERLKNSVLEVSQKYG